MSYQNKHKNLTCSGHSRSVYVFSDEQLTVGLFVSNQNSLSTTLSVNFSIFWYILGQLYTDPHNSICLHYRFTFINGIYGPPKPVGFYSKFLINANKEI